MAKRMTQVRLAELLGISQQAVSVCARQGMPTHSLAAAQRWRFGNLSVAKSKPPPAATVGTSNGITPAVEHAKLAKARRERVELENAVRRGELLPAAGVLASSLRAGMTVRDAMLSIPGRTAAQIASMTDEREIDRYLTDVIRAELTRLADSVAPAADA